MAVPKTSARPESCREEILRAATRLFARRGYAGASIQDIVDAARVTKPALYYHFASKAALYRALVDHALDGRYQLMQAAAQRAGTAAGRLTAIATALFEFAQEHQELSRLTLAALFAAPEEVPASVRNLAKAQRNFDFIRELVTAGQRAGELTREFTAEQLAFAVFGQVNVSIMAHLLLPDCRLDRARARQVVALFLEGARAPAPVRRRAR